MITPNVVPIAHAGSGPHCPRAAAMTQVVAAETARFLLMASLAGVDISRKAVAS